MFLWLKKDYHQVEGEMMISFDPPEEGEEDLWLMLTTRDRHYKDIAKELRKVAAQYDKSGDYKSKNIALNLADTLVGSSVKSTTVN